VHKHWRLNERHYGNLVGMNKKEVVKVHGEDQVKRWRRSWDEPPPPMVDDHEFHPALDPRYWAVSLCFLFYLFKSIFLIFVRFSNHHFALFTFITTPNFTLYHRI